VDETQTDRLAEDGDELRGGLLREFVDVKKVQATLTRDLQRLRDYSATLSLERSLQPIDDALAHLHDDTFSIAVVGEFKRGKSTLINALLGRNVLPADILPTTATLNRVVYGLRPGVSIRFRNGRSEEIEIDQLSDYVTKFTSKSRQVAASIAEAVVSYPVPYLRNNVEIYDTPGLNDEESMTAVTDSVVPSVDAAILVIIPQSPFSQYEADFLERKLLTSDLAKVIFVVNRIDTLAGPAETARIVNYVKERVRENILQRAAQLYGENSEEYRSQARKIGEPKVFGVASDPALEAKMADDQTGLVSSCFPGFEAALEKFLIEERGPLLLQVPLNRIRAAAKEVLDAIRLRQTSLEMKREEFLAAYEKSTQELADLRVRKTDELRRIDGAAAVVSIKVRPLVEQLPTELLAAADAAIDSASIEPEDLRGDQRIKATNEQLSAEIAERIKGSSRLFAERIQVEIEKGLREEAARLRGFTQTVDEVLSGITAQFDTIEADTRAPRSGAVEGVMAFASIWTGLGGIWSGYRQAGWQGAAVGAGASVGVALGVGVLIGILSMPVSLPVIAVIGIVSFLTGGGAVRMLLGGQIVKNFRENYKKRIHEELTRQLVEQDVGSKVNDQIHSSFSALKSKINEEVEAVLDNTHNTLADLRAKRERDETLTEQERRDLAEMHLEVQRIQGNAQRLADQIVPVANV
jgi:GTPase SAR1 family protein